MRVVEIMGIEQARKWGVCTMNEFREFVGLKKYGSFKEWNPTGDIAVSFLASLELVLCHLGVY
jgi:linoleate 10R-lipoxygenase